MELESINDEGKERVESAVDTRVIISADSLMPIIEERVERLDKSFVNSISNDIESIEPPLDKIETESEAKEFVDDNGIQSEICRLEELNAAREPEVGKDGMDVDGLVKGQDCRNSNKENIEAGEDSRNSVVVNNGKEPSR